jgi:hypothetical protein
MGLDAVTCRFALMGSEICALAGELRAVVWADVSVCADGEDVLGSHGSADRVLLPS